MHSSTPTLEMLTGQLLRDARDRLSFSEEDIAQKTGMSITQIRALEKGDVTPFQRGGNNFEWHAQLYAKKINLTLPMDRTYASASPILDKASLSHQEGDSPRIIPESLRKKKN
jgi:transcriptional regulator with XRE-family HTH domain